jgi:hypothetical protein
MTAATQPGLDKVLYTSAGKAGHTALKSSYLCHFSCLSGFASVAGACLPMFLCEYTIMRVVVPCTPKPQLFVPVPLCVAYVHAQW